MRINFYRWIPLAIITIPSLNAQADRVIAAMMEALPQPAPVATVGPNAHAIAPITVGSTVAGYRVTSGYGNRPAPCPGCSSHHPGIDVATPTGTPLYAPGEVSVRCKSEAAGGHYAEFDYQGMTHQFLHLAPGSCQPGMVGKGEPFAATGASGRGTGPHLDYRVKQGGQRVYPPVEVLTAALDPTAFQDEPAPGEPIPDDVLKRAIGRAEGTRDAAGNPTRAFYGHTDPGWSGRCQNQGTFSYQHCAATPEDADRAWLATLRTAEQEPHRRIPPASPSTCRRNAGSAPEYRRAVPGGEGGESRSR